MTSFSAAADAKKHVQYVDQLLTLLENVGITLNLKQYFFFYKRDIVCVWLSTMRRSTSLKILHGSGVMEVPRRKVTDALLLGCRKSIQTLHSFGNLDRSLTNPLRKNAEQTWKQPFPCKTHAFDYIRNTLAKPPVLELPIPDRL